MGALAGFVVGGTVGLGLGFVVYLLLREAVLPYSLWSSDAVMWLIVGAVAIALAFLGARGGGRTGSRRGLRIIVGVLLGLVGGAVAALLVAMFLAYAFDISQREGAYAMGVVFVLMPLGAAAGAIVGALLAMRRGGAPKQTAATDAERE